MSGDLSRFGFEVILYQYLSRKAFDYTISLPTDVLEICINVEGVALIHGGQHSKILPPEKAFLYNTFGTNTLHLRRLAGKHQFISILYSKAWIEMMMSLQSERKKTHFPEPREFPWTPEIGEIVSICNHARNTQDALSLPVLAQQLLANVLEQSQHYRSAPTDSPNRIQRIDWVKNYLKNHLNEPLSLEFLAEQAGCTSSHLSRSFTASEGVTLSKYLRKIRLEAACKLLSENNLSITEIALETGYQSLSHFSQIFHRDQGCTPQTYRRRFR